MTDATESAAIAATLCDSELLLRVRDIAGRDIGDPLNDQADSVRLREQFDLTIEYTHSSVLAFNDDGVCASLGIHSLDPQERARRAACIAVASMWTPSISDAAKRTQKKDGWKKGDEVQCGICQSIRLMGDACWRDDCPCHEDHCGDG